MHHCHSPELAPRKICANKTSRRVICPLCLSRWAALAWSFPPIQAACRKAYARARTLFCSFSRGSFKYFKYQVIHLKSKALGLNACLFSNFSGDKSPQSDIFYEIVSVVDVLLFGRLLFDLRLFSSTHASTLAFDIFVVLVTIYKVVCLFFVEFIHEHEVDNEFSWLFASLRRLRISIISSRLLVQ